MAQFKVHNFYSKVYNEQKWSANNVLWVQFYQEGSSSNFVTTLNSFQLDSSKSKINNCFLMDLWFWIHLM